MIRKVTCLERSCVRLARRRLHRHTPRHRWQSKAKPVGMDVTLKRRDHCYPVSGRKLGMFTPAKGVN